MKKKDPAAKPWIYTIPFARVYPMYIQKAEKKGRTKAEVDEIIRWLLGYNAKELAGRLKQETLLEPFLAEAPRLNPARSLIKGVVCGVRVEDIKDPTMQTMRYLDKLIDELAKGRPMEKILRENDRPPREIHAYHDRQAPGDKAICDFLYERIRAGLPGASCKIWHGHPVWFLEGNPIVGYHKLKDCVRLLFWSGQSFKTKGLVKEGTFKAADVRYATVDDIDPKMLAKWLKESRSIQWDYKHIVKHKGKLVRT